MKDGEMFPAKILILATCIALTGCSKPVSKAKLKYYGADSRQALVDFTATVEIPFAGALVVNDLKNMDSPLYKKVMEGIDKQSEFVFAVFKEHHEPTDFASHPGSVKNQPDIKILHVDEEVKGQSVMATYTYHNLGAFQQDLFADAAPLNVTFRLPKNPYTTYADGVVPIAQALNFYQNSPWAVREIQKDEADGTKTFNLCTDVHYNTEDDYWYFWNPDLAGCPEQAREDMVHVDGVLTPQANTVQTFPEYDRLVTGGTMRIKYLVGIDDTFEKNDLGARGFEKTFQMLTMGKKVLSLPPDKITLTKGERSILNAATAKDFATFRVVKNLPTRREIRLKTKKFTASIDMELWDPTTDAFGDAVIDGMRNYNVFIYNGHSGLGEFLGRDVLFRDNEKLDTGKYQVFFFNGCSTYAYYDLDYFDMKKSPNDPNGTKNLDIITATIGADFSIGPGSDVMLLEDLVKASASWQQILDHIYAVDPSRSALIQINGDEDNPTTPPNL